MLEKILIQNFQSHERFKLEFDPRVTTIVGPSDVGKSSIMRALWWVASNSPRGDAFIRWGAKGAVVQLYVDGRKISRRRSSSSNTYHLDDSEFVSFGNEVPDEIAGVINLSRVNFQSQLDPSFWFSLTAGEVSRQLNSVINLEIIDRAIASVGSQVRKVAKELEVVQDRLQTSKENYKALDWVVDADEEFQGVETLWESKSLADLLMADLSELVIGVAQAKRTQETASERSEGGKLVGLLGQKATNKAKVTKTLEKLISKVEKSKIKVDRDLPDFGPVQQKLDTYNKIAGRPDELDRMLKKIRRLGEKLEIAQDIEGEMVDRLNEATEGRCPVCGGEFDGSICETEKNAVS